MVVTNFLVKKRKISQIDSVPYTGEDNIDTFKFEFDEEWEGLDKTLVIVSGEHRYNIALLHDQCVVPFEFYQIKGNVLIGLFGTDGTYQTLATGWLPIYVEEDSYEVGVEPDNLPSQTQWDAFVTEINRLLEQAQATEQQCEQILGQITDLKNTTKGYMDTTEGYKDTTEGYKNTTKQYMDTTEGYKNTTKGYKDDVNTTVTNFNNNVEQKTTDFNNNATQKTDTFNNNATSKTNAFNLNASDKTTAFNDNASSKTTAFDNNATSKTGTFNGNVTDKTTAFNNNATSKTGDFNDNATSKTNTFNQNATDKTTAFNDNYTAKVNAFNEGTSEYVQRLGNVEDVLGIDTDTFSTSNTYAVGDVVVYDNKFYRCKTAITTAGAWDSSKWDEINVRQELDEKETRIEELEEHLALVESNYDTGVATGSDIQLTDALNGYNQGIVVEGNTTQVQTTGKNKFNISGIENTSKIDVSSIALFITGSDEFNPTNEGNTLSDFADLTVGETYILSFDTTYTGSHYNSIWISSLSQRWTAGTSKTITQEMLDSRIAFYGDKGTVISKIQIEAGSTVSEYEPYTNGQPAPTPTNPQPIVNTTGTQTIISNNGNFLDYKTVEPTSNTTVTLIDNGFKVVGKYASSVTIHNLPKYTDFYLNYIRTNIVGSYTYVKIFAGTSQSLTLKSIQGPDTFNTGNNTTINIWFYAGSGVQNNESNFTNIILSKGTTAAAYTPYKGKDITLHLGDIHLRKIGNYKDYIYKEDGKWYLYKTINSVTLNGSEDWQENTNYTTASMLVAQLKRTDAKSGSSIFVSHFKSSGSTVINSARFATTYLLIGLDITQYATVIGFKTWLSTNNIIVDYILDTPTITEITDQTLLADLAELEKMQTYKGETNIIVTASSGNPAQLELTYLKDDRVSKEDFELLKARVELLEE